MRGGVEFAVPYDEVERRLDEWHDAYLTQGAYLFRYETTFGYGEADTIVLLPTDDKFEVIRRARTDGINYGLTNKDVISWLRDLDRTHPFRVTGAGLDFVEGRFEHPPEDALDLAQRMYRFCPDIVDQGTESVAALAEELEKGYLYVWWD